MGGLFLCSSSKGIHCVTIAQGWVTSSGFVPNVSVCVRVCAPAFVEL